MRVSTIRTGYITSSTGVAMAMIMLIPQLEMIHANTENMMIKTLYLTLPPVRSEKYDDTEVSRPTAVVMQAQVTIMDMIR